uniref:Uncharacterized protein n=1 Tax=Rhizophora mucronata TaxID=61149 RepID=A0A2P2IU94_RHIMU
MSYCKPERHYNKKLKVSKTNKMLLCL